MAWLTIHFPSNFLLQWLRLPRFYHRKTKRWTSNPFSRRISVVTVEVPIRRVEPPEKRRYRWTIRRRLCHLYRLLLRLLYPLIRQVQARRHKIAFYHHLRLHRFLPATLRTPMHRWIHRQCRRRCTHYRSHEYPPPSRRIIMRDYCHNRKYPPPRQKWKPSIGTRYQITRFASLLNDLSISAASIHIVLSFRTPWFLGDR